LFQLLRFFDTTKIDYNNMKDVGARNNCCITEQVYFTEILHNDSLDAFDAVDGWIFLCS